MIFTDRRQAGLLLAERLKAITYRIPLIVGLPRGGIVVAWAVSEKLGIPLDCLVVKKIPSPMQPELGIGALAPDGVMVVDWKLSHRLSADEDYLNSQIAALSEQIKQKTTLYRKGRKPLNVRGKTIFLVDDGAATGATIETAVKWLRKKKAARIIAAVPVAASDVVGKIKPEVDELVVLAAPAEFNAVGQFYKTFPQTEDSEVVKILQNAQKTQ